MSVKYQTFSNAPNEDPDEHCILFEEAYLANHPFTDPANPTAAEQLLMKWTFAAQMLGPAKAWVSQYATNAFQTYDALKTPFLESFRTERTTSHVLVRLNSILQLGRSIHEYAAEFRRLLNRIPIAEQPSVPLQCEYFIQGLDYPEALLTQDLQTATLMQIINLAIKVDKLRKNPGSNLPFGSATTTPVQTVGPSAYTPSTWSNRVSAGMMTPGGVGAAGMMGPSTSGGVQPFRPGVWCTKCRLHGHHANECTLPSLGCTICYSTTHATADCVYNGLNRAGLLQQSAQ